MELLRVEKDAGAAPSWVRVTGWVRTAAGPDPEAIWYEVEERHAASLATSGDPWLACGLPMAVTAGQPFVSRVPIDPRLVDNARERMDIWRAWDKRRALVPIECDTAVAPPGEGRSSTFFSGGIDSWFTVLRERAAPLDDLLLIHGTRDLPHDVDAGFERTRAGLARVASELGHELVVVRTNLLQTSATRTDRRYMGFGSLIGSVALALGSRWSRVLVPASLDVGWLGAWGAHPLTTPLLSTTRTQFVEHGVAHSRFQKTEIVARSSLALGALRVCLATRDETNCMACEKCLRTAVALELLGVLGQVSTFPPRLDLRAVAASHMSGWAERYYFEELLEVARARRRHDVAAALQLALAHSKLRERVRPLGRWLRGVSASSRRRARSGL